MSGRVWRYVPFIVWPAATAVALLWRVPLAIDETRYLTVAWEMFSTGDWVLPQLNGAIYSHKPPLLFWLIAFGWHGFGISEWWPRLVPALAGLAAWLVLWRLARRLWGQVEELPALAVIVAGGALMWALVAGMILFDLVLTLWVLVALLGLARAADGEVRGWLVFGVGLGLALLTKGPVALLHVLPVALLGPWWSAAARDGSRRWYAGLAGALALGIAVAATWAVPAWLAGGAAYMEGLLWMQAAGRLSDSFAHDRPVWWYLPVVPLLVLPWSLWRPAWRALRDGVQPLEPGARFCLAWSVPPFVAFCLISGKQPHYLLPLLPAVALLVARGLATSPAASYRRARCWALTPWLAVGALMAASPWLGGNWHRGWLEDLHPAWGGAVLVIAAWAAAPFRVSLAAGAARLHAAAVLGTALIAAGMLGSAAGRAYGVGAAAAEVGRAQQQGVAIAYYGAYHGQLGFAARLQRPVLQLADAASIARLSRDHPGALVLVESDRNPLAAAPVLPQSAYHYRTGHWSLWRAGALALHPGALATIGAPPPSPDGAGEWGDFGY